MARTDIQETITSKIIAAIEDGSADGKWEMPWHRVGQDTIAPRNARSKRVYRGINVIELWLAAEEKGYTSGEWATYKQWSEMKAQVRKGEKSTAVVLWRPFSKEVEGEAKTFLVMRTFAVFNAQQVDGYTPPEAVTLSEPERDARAEAFFGKLGATIRFGGNLAYYAPGKDRDFIALPERNQFTSAHAFYSTEGHEHIHWSGAEHRLNRDLRHRFGDEAYAMEELVAELGSAFLNAYLGIATEPRLDHAKYLKSWLKVLKNDPKAIFTAASRASAALEYLQSQAGEHEDVNRTGEEVPA